MSDLPLDVLRQVTLAGGVLDQDHLADTDHPALAIAGWAPSSWWQVELAVADRSR